MGSHLHLAYLQKLQSLRNYESNSSQGRNFQSQLGPYCLMVKPGVCLKTVKFVNSQLFC